MTATADVHHAGPRLDMEEISGPDDGTPSVESWEPQRVVEMADHRVAHAAHFENDGPAADRVAAIADRARWAEREAHQSHHAPAALIAAGLEEAAEARTGRSPQKPAR